VGRKTNHLESVYAEGKGERRALYLKFNPERKKIVVEKKKKICGCGKEKRKKEIL